MATNPQETELVHAERQVLRALCQGTPQGSVYEDAKRLLKDYRWRNPQHRALFEIFLTLPSLDPAAVRAYLPSLLTRRGFPDVAWEDLFEPHTLSKDEAVRLMRELRESLP